MARSIVDCELCGAQYSSKCTQSLQAVFIKQRSAGREINRQAAPLTDGARKRLARHRRPLLPLCCRAAGKWMLAAYILIFSQAAVFDARRALPLQLQQRYPRSKQLIARATSVCKRRAPDAVPANWWPGQIKTPKPKQRCRRAKPRSARTALVRLGFEKSSSKIKDYPHAGSTVEVAETKGAAAV